MFLSTIFFLTTSILSSVLADDNSSPIQSFSLNGSGCPSGSVSSVNSGNSIVANFSAFSAALGGGADPLDARRNCQATITVKPSAGYRFYPGATTYSGNFDLNSQVTATRTSLYYFQSSITQETKSDSITGPQYMSYTVTDTFSGSGPTSACGATAIVNINLAVALDNGSTNNAGSGAVTQAKFGNFLFEKC